MKLLEKAKLAPQPTKQIRGKRPMFNTEELDTIRYLRSSRHWSFKDIHKFFNDNGKSCSYPTVLNALKTASRRNQK